MTLAIPTMARAVDEAANSFQISKPRAVTKTGAPWVKAYCMSVPGDSLAGDVVPKPAIDARWKLPVGNHSGQ